jgi:hypothetical protein
MVKGAVMRWDESICFRNHGGCFGGCAKTGDGAAECGDERAAEASIMALGGLEMRIQTRETSIIMSSSAAISLQHGVQ